jgi:hypothetical protein
MKQLGPLPRKESIALLELHRKLNVRVPTARRNLEKFFDLTIRKPPVGASRRGFSFSAAE